MLLLLLPLLSGELLSGFKAAPAAAAAGVGSGSTKVPTSFSPLWFLNSTVVSCRLAAVAQEGDRLRNLCRVRLTWYARWPGALLLMCEAADKEGCDAAILCCARAKPTYAVLYVRPKQRRKTIGLNECCLAQAVDTKDSERCGSDIQSCDLWMSHQHPHLPRR